MPVNEGLARQSDTMLVSAIGILSVAMLLYAVEYAFGRTGRVGAAAGVLSNSREKASS